MPNEIMQRVASHLLAPEDCIALGAVNWSLSNALSSEVRVERACIHAHRAKKLEDFRGVLTDIQQLPPRFRLKPLTLLGGQILALPRESLGEAIAAFRDAATDVDARPEHPLKRLLEAIDSSEGPVKGLESMENSERSKLLTALPLLKEGKRIANVAQELGIICAGSRRRLEKKALDLACDKVRKGENVDNVAQQLGLDRDLRSSVEEAAVEFTGLQAVARVGCAQEVADELGISGSKSMTRLRQAEAKVHVAAGANVQEQVKRLDLTDEDSRVLEEFSTGGPGFDAIDRGADAEEVAREQGITDRYLIELLKKRQSNMQTYAEADRTRP